MGSPYLDLLQSYKTDGQPKWSERSESAVLEPYDYLLSNPGKDIRSTLIHAFNVWLRVPPELLSIVLQAIEMLHTASLLVDDVEDNSDLRRGREAAHLKYGAASTINAANYIYFSAMAKIRSTGHPGVMAIYEEEILNLHRGQGLELYWRDGHGLDGQAQTIFPTETEYLAMVNDKTGGLLRMAIRLLQALSPRRGETGGDGEKATNYVPLANMVGILFQIRDDYMNLSSLQYCREKGFCEDLTEGKFSFPVIHGIGRRHHQPDLAGASRLVQILRRKTDDVELKIEACEILERLGSLTYTIHVLGQMDRVCRDEIALLGGNHALTGILDLLRTSGDGSEITATIEFARKAWAK